MAWREIITVRGKMSILKSDPNSPPIVPGDQGREAAARPAARGVVAAVKKDREPSEA